MKFIELWFCLLGTIFTLTYIFKSLIEISILIKNEDIDKDEEIPENIKNSMFS